MLLAGRAGVGRRTAAPLVGQMLDQSSANFSPIGFCLGGVSQFVVVVLFQGFLFGRVSIPCLLFSFAMSALSIFLHVQLLPQVLYCIVLY